LGNTLAGTSNTHHNIRFGEVRKKDKKGAQKQTEMK
jgi:hypothetical protein